MTEIFHTQKQAHLLFSTLRLLGVAKVSVPFSGGGDSGNVDNVQAFNSHGGEIDITTTTINWVFVQMDSKWSPATNTYSIETNSKEQPATLNKIIESMCNNALEISQLDWWNNEGGQGSFDIDLTKSPPTVTLDIGINTMVTEDHTFDFYEPMTEEDANASMPSQPE